MWGRPHREPAGTALYTGDSVDFFEKRPYTPGWIAADEQIGNDSGTRRARLEDRAHVGERDAADRHHGKTQSSGDADQIEADRLVAGGLRGCTEHGTDGKIAHGLASTMLELIDRMRRETHDRRRAEQPPGIGRAEILLPDVDSGSTRQQRQIRPIVDDRHDAGCAAIGHDGRTQIKRGAAGGRLRTYLQTSRAAFGELMRQLARRPPAALGELRVDDGVQRRKGQTASARPLLAGLVGYRSMKDVFTLPARKSGSAMILRCSGTLVLMP